MRTTPVVQVVIEGDSITVDGVVLPWPPGSEGRQPYDVALAALATSATRRRPVRAEIFETSGITRCLVLPDATTKDLRFTYTGGSDVAAHSQTVEAARTVARQVTRPSFRLPTFAVPRAWLRPALVGVGAATAATLVVVGVVVLTGSSADRASEDELSTTAGTPTVPVSSPTHHAAHPLPALNVSASGGVGSVTFTGDSLQIRVMLSGPETRDDRLTVTPEGVVLDGLKPGTYHWRATAVKHQKVTGDVVVEAEPVTSTPEATASQEPPPAQQTFAPPVDPDRN